MLLRMITNQKAYSLCLLMMINMAPKLFQRGLNIAEIFGSSVCMLSSPYLAMKKGIEIVENSGNSEMLKQLFFFAVGFGL